jgi:hypothetical protein
VRSGYSLDLLLMGLPLAHLFSAVTVPIKATSLYDLLLPGPRNVLTLVPSM